MALQNVTVRLLIFFLVFSIILPVAGYTFTNIGNTPTTGDLDPQALIDAGIILTDSVTHNVTRDADHTHFVLGTSEYRITWSTANHFVWERRNNFFGWDLRPFTLDPYPITEADIILDWEPLYNWTQVTVSYYNKTEFECFFTPYPGFSTIATSLADGNVTVTIGSTALPAGSDLFSFAGWFLGLISGHDTYGMPDFFIWILRIFTFIGILAFVILAKEFIPTLP